MLASRLVFLKLALSVMTHRSPLGGDKGIGLCAEVGPGRGVDTREPDSHPDRPRDLRERFACQR